jgi:hypothetical protein
MSKTILIFLGSLVLGIFLIVGILISWVIATGILIFILLSVVIMYFILNTINNFNQKRIRRIYEKNKNDKGKGKYRDESGRVEGTRSGGFRDTASKPSNDLTSKRPRANKFFSFRKPKDNNNEPRENEVSSKPNRFTPI